MALYQTKSQIQTQYSTAYCHSKVQWTVRATTIVSHWLKVTITVSGIYLNPKGAEIHINILFKLNCQLLTACYRQDLWSHELAWERMQSVATGKTLLKGSFMITAEICWNAGNSNNSISEGFERRLYICAGVPLTSFQIHLAALWRSNG